MFPLSFLDMRVFGCAVSQKTIHNYHYKDQNGVIFRLKQQLAFAILKRKHRNLWGH